MRLLLHRVASALVLGVLVVAMFASSVLVYRCRGRVVVAESCCCPHRQADPSSTAELRRAPCCKSEVVSPAPAPPVDLAVAFAAPSLPPTSYALVVPPLVSGAPTADELIRPATGPPLILAKQSFLI